MRADSLTASGAFSPLEHWLARCAGFRVESPDAGRIGTLEEVLYGHGPAGDRPRALAVRTGVLGRRLLLFPVEEIEEIRFEQGRILLRNQPSALDRRATAPTELHRMPARPVAAPRSAAFFRQKQRRTR
jgi:hypothetical protein